jgi:hypothetical protein
MVPSSSLDRIGELPSGACRCGRDRGADGDARLPHQRAVSMDALRPDSDSTGPRAMPGASVELAMAAHAVGWSGIPGLVPGCGGIGSLTLLPTRQSHFRAVLELAAFLGSVNGPVAGAGAASDRVSSVDPAPRVNAVAALTDVCALRSLRRQVTGRRVVLAAGIAGLGFLAGGCGGGSKAPSVASLGPGTSTGATTGGSSPSGSPATARASFVAFGSCMTKHGVPVSVSVAPGGRGAKIAIGNGGGGPNSVDPASSHFQAAQKACQKLLPGGGPQALTPAQQAQARRQALTLAACIRSHGLPNFPDPTSQGAFNLNGIDPSSSQFQAAMKACRPSGGRGPVRFFSGPPGATPP